MSILKEYIVQCDRCKQGSEGATSTLSSADARKSAKDAGWRHFRGLDICPTCVTQLSNMQAGTTT